MQPATANLQQPIGGVDVTDVISVRSPLLSQTHAMRTAKIIQVKSTHAAACACSMLLAFTKVNSLGKAPGGGRENR